ncbi:MAG TPA: glycoside hydrolase family 47 protein [Caulobacteraceae bacterium]|nr:glycoside hydrolase family 47 protein [Caulobacteraceae bacterium]
MSTQPIIHRREALLGLGAAAAAGPVFAKPHPAHARQAHRDWKGPANEVREAMAFAWAGYRERAFGADQIKPVSGGKESFFFPQGPSLGLSMVEALGTLYVMRLDQELDEAIRWISDHLRFDIDADIQLFETTIRMVGGLVSGYLATREKKLLSLARDLTDRLMPAFKTPTGLPYRFVNLKTGVPRDKITFPAEFGSFAPEFGILGRLVNDRRYYDAAKAAAKAGFDRRSKLDLIPDTIDVETGAWQSRRATIGPPSDSYYEYLWGAWRLFGDKDMKRWFEVHTEATLKHQSDRVDGRLWFAQVDYETGQRLDRKQSELASFYAGLLGKGGWMREGRDYLEAWAVAQERFGVLPEGLDYEHMAATRKTNDLRPEFANSCLDLWQIDRNKRWRELAYKHFRTMVETSKTTYGFTVIADITTKPMVQGDFVPATGGRSR